MKGSQRCSKQHPKQPQNSAYLKHLLFCFCYSIIIILLAPLNISSLPLILSMKVLSLAHVVEYHNDNYQRINIKQKVAIQHHQLSVTRV